MATSRPFAYNSGSPVSGTTQVGNLAIAPVSGNVDLGTGLDWVNGPDEDSYYVMARPIQPPRSRTDSQGSAGVAFWASAKTDQDFLSAASYFFEQSFASASAAKSWMETNGYWTSWTATNVNTAQFYYDPGNSSSYSGSGTTLINIGTLGDITGTKGALSGVAYDPATALGVFNFDGIADKITFGQYNFGTALTVNAWVYPQTEFSINCLMSNCGANTATNGFKMSWNNWNTTNYTMNFEAGNGSSGGTTSTAQNTVVAGQWQMLTFVFNRTTPSITFYRNSTQIATASGGAPVSNIGMNNTNWWMGSIGGNSYYMNALMGEFKAWTSILPDIDIVSEYDNSKDRYGL